MSERRHPTPGAAERALTAAFGGRWMAWEPGPAGPAGSTLWVQLTEVDGRWQVTSVLLSSDGVRADDLRRIPIAVIENAVNLKADQGEGVDPESLPPLVRSPGMRPEDWSRLVAAHYRAHARRDPNPGAAIAHRWGVNRQTVAAWIREARLRGFLPPARRTKSGE